MLSEIASVAFSGVGGSLFGGILGLGKQFLNQRHEREMAIHEEKIANIEKEIAQEENEAERVQMQMKYDNAEKLANVKANMAIDTATVKARGAVSAKESTETGPRMNAFRASVRPVLAYIFSTSLLAMTGVLLFKYGTDVSPEQYISLLVQCLQAIIASTTLIISFYYVARPERRNAN